MITGCQGFSGLAFSTDEAKHVNLYFFGENIREGVNRKLDFDHSSKRFGVGDHITF